MVNKKKVKIEMVAGEYHIVGPKGTVVVPPGQNIIEFLKSKRTREGKK